MGIIRHAVGALLAAFIISGSAVAQISLDLRPDAPGSDRLVLEWVADASLSGPFDLLRKVVPAGESVADALPLDPVADLYLTGFLNGNTLSRRQEATGDPGARVYQLVTASGGCSNLAYVVKHQPSLTLGPEFFVAVPWSGGTRRTRDFLLEHPHVALVRVITRQAPAGRPFVRETRRLADGSPGPQDYWIPPGAGLQLSLFAAEPLVIVGAADPAPRALAAGGDELPAGALTSILSLPLAATTTQALAVLCGERGVDWTPTPDGRCAESCLGGLHVSGLQAGPQPSTSISQREPDGLSLGMVVITLDPATAPHCVANFDGELDASLAIVEHAGEGSGPPRLWLPEDAGVAAGCRCLDSDGDGDDDCTELLRGTDPADRTSFGPDHDRDGIGDWGDNCPATANPAQEDADFDDFGDACDVCPDGLPACEDADADGLSFLEDNCPDVANPGQEDRDYDGVGDACDLCPEDAERRQEDTDGDGRGDICDCAPDDADTWGQPVPLGGLRVGLGPEAMGVPTVTLSWNDDAALIGPSRVHDLAGGDLDAMWADGIEPSASCLERNLPDNSWFATEAGSRWYLARTRNSCGAGSWGSDEQSSPLDDSDPCP